MSLDPGDRGHNCRVPLPREDHVPADRPRVLGSIAASTSLLLLLTACSHGGGRVARASADTTGSTDTTLAPSTPSTAAATSSTTAKAKPAPPPGLGVGSKGPEVAALEQRLADMKYDVGKVDGVYDGITAQAVIAFQKVNGLPRTGRATKDVTDKLPTATVPAPLLPSAEPFRVEIDLPRQVLFLYEGGQLARTLMISSGGGYRYCVKGACDRAITPGGAFRVGRKIKGKHISPLGVLYNPLFFNGGIAIHGEPAVPVTPASHGCVRIPMSASAWFYNEVPSGTPVYVVGGPKAPVPFNTPAPDGTPPNPPQTSPTTSTTAAPTTTTSTTPSTTTSSSTTSSTSTSTTSTTVGP
jgi:peptidoglycan hydrolase-like protein with peptidoglycan-binding domain